MSPEATRAMGMTFERALKECAAHNYADGYEAGHHDGLAAGMARASTAYDAGYEAAVRDFWAGVCEERASQEDRGAEEATRMSEHVKGGPLFEYAKWRWRAYECRQQADQLRAWAREGCP